jgi:hypothetical protein
MRIQRLIPIVVVLFILAATTMTTIQHRLIGVESSTASAQKAIEATSVAEQSDGTSPIVEQDTTDKVDTDLYLDADEVERRAAEEQASDTTVTPTGRVPVSFKHVALPLPGGIDHAVAGVATRNSGQGVIRLRGVPPGSVLLSALLVWGEITAPPALGYNVGFGPDCAQGAVVASAVYGTAPQPCWNPNGVYAGHIVNVTAQIVAGINGDYRIRGLKSALTNNRCPWGDGNCAGPGNALTLSEGASLIVIYANACIPKAAQLYISLGPRMFFGNHNVNHPTFPAINGNLPNLKHSRIGADGQVGVLNCGLRAMTQITNERTWIQNAANFALIQIKGDGGGLNRDSDWNGYDGEPLNKLWDSHTDVFGSGAFLAAGGGNSYNVLYSSQGDCIVWAAHILGVR